MYDGTASSHRLTRISLPQTGDGPLTIDEGVIRPPQTSPYDASYPNFLLKPIPSTTLTARPKTLWVGKLQGQTSNLAILRPHDRLRWRLVAAYKRLMGKPMRFLVVGAFRFTSPAGMAGGLLYSSGDSLRGIDRSGIMRLPPQVLGCLVMPALKTPPFKSVAGQNQNNSYRSTLGGARIRTPLRW